MKQLFTKKASLWFRGLAILMVIASHYAEWWEWFTKSEGHTELWRQAISSLGPYGVAIFFLFSGYGLVCSAGNGPMTFAFIRKRVLASYLPYLIVVGIIEAISDGFVSLHDFGDYLSGHDYWFMVILFLFYIVFIAVWAIPANKHIHAVLFTLFTLGISIYYYRDGSHSFWFISNPAFAVGVLLALYEPFFKKWLKRTRSPMLVLLTAGMAVSIYYALFSAAPSLWTPEKTINTELAAVFVFTLLVVYLASDLRYFDPLLPFLGKYSLYLYLTHQFIFMRVINTLDCSFALRFVAAAVITLAVSLPFGMLITFLADRLNGLCMKKKVNT
ncbi:MAG: acyltransferase [Lachnospiraceae bacterium]|nr:acyltransferase [Lachnospiraceae bacterium]